jgi:hypothetical protein
VLAGRPLAKAFDPFVKEAWTFLWMLLTFGRRLCFSKTSGMDCAFFGANGE